MKAVILAIGDELLIGQIVNSNASFIASRLEAAGVEVIRMTTVGDDGGAIAGAFDESMRDADITVCTGGLGPTPDDMTKKIAASHFGMPLEEDPQLRDRIAGLLASRNIPWGPAADEQCLVPRGARTIPNPSGTAVGLIFEKNRRTLVLLPGVPPEMAAMMTEFVIPMVEARSGRSAIRHRTLRTAGAGEQTLWAKIGDELPGGARLAYLPSLTGVRLRITARAASAEEADRSVAIAEEFIRSRLGDSIYGEEDEELEHALGKILSERSLSVAVAESCTGGLVARKLTSVPGSSRYFLGAIVAYDNALKIKLLGVPQDLLDRHGAVSKECALAMAGGIRSATGASIGLSVTGIAGPAGGAPDKPVGLVWTAYSDKNGTAAVRHTFGEGRERVTERASAALLNLARMKLLN